MKKIITYAIIMTCRALALSILDFSRGLPIQLTQVVASGLRSFLMAPPGKAPETI